MRKLRYDVEFSSDYDVVNIITSSKNGCDLIYQIADNKGFDHRKRQSAEYSLCAQQFFSRLSKTIKTEAGRVDFPLNVSPDISDNRN